MAFQASFLRDGHWVTEAVNVQAALQASATKEEQAETIVDRGPCGILTSTVLESPVVNKILPVRLRSREHNDIAFIGDHTVTIKELKDNGQTYEILKYRNNDSRIRNAVVLGSPPEDDYDENHEMTGNEANGDDTLDHSIYQHDDLQPKRQAQFLPPQFLVLALSSGKLIFLFIRDVFGSPEFYIDTHSLDRPTPFLGHHLAVDPYSRFIVQACLEDLLVVYELVPLKALNETYMATGSLGNPFKAICYRSLRGTIYDVQFLYPRPQDDYLVILMAIFSSKSRDSSGTSKRKYIVWDWEAGEDLRVVLARPDRRQTLTETFDIPLFAIPLKSQNAFFVVFPRHIGIVRQTLSAAEFDFNSVLEGPKPSGLHHGANPPLWTSWARPFRRKDYSEKTDIIYLAREDGFVFHIEIDSDTMLYSGMELGSIGSHIGTAFTTAYDRFSDLLIVGGESGPGGIWKLAPRSELEKISTHADWSPVVDMVAVGDGGRNTSEHSGTHGAECRLQGQPDRLFFASGRGASGSLTEMRIGLKARIGLDLDIGDFVKEAWLFTDQRVQNGSMFAILAMHTSTTILQIDGAFSDVVPLSDEPAQFDASSRTLHATQLPNGMIVQASERCIALFTGSQFSRHDYCDLLRADDTMAEKAFCLDHFVILCVQTAERAEMHALQLEDMSVSLRSSWEVPGEISCLTLIRANGKTQAIVGTVIAGALALSIYSLDGELVVRRLISDLTGSDLILEPLTSIAVTHEMERKVDMVAGTRCGHLLTITISPDSDELIQLNAERLGSSLVDVFSSDRLNENVSAFAACDNRLFRLSGLCRNAQRYRRKDYVWPTDASDPSLAAPPIHYVFRISQTGQGVEVKDVILFLSGTKLYVADVEYRVGPVPRTIPLGHTPTRLIYSTTRNCLVVAVRKNEGVDLVLIDHNTGASLSKPLDGRKREGYLAGFDTKGDTILGLHEWNHIKDGKTFSFLIATMRSGKLAVVSVSSITIADDDFPGRRFEHWTRFRKTPPGGPVYSVVSDQNGLLYCAGNTLYRDILDLADKKIRTATTFELESPATSLQISNGRLLALTQLHSIQVIDYHDDGESEINILHSDDTCRAGTHMIEMEHAADESRWPIAMVATVEGGLTGHWAPLGQGVKDLERVFETKLRNTIWRFTRTRCRPVWSAEEASQLRFGTLLSTMEGSDLLGVSVDGSLFGFRLLGLELWRFLQLIQRLARGSPMTTPVGIDSSEDENEDLSVCEAKPDKMHINGDILAYCLEKHLLEKMVENAHCLDQFCQHLDGLDGGSYTAGFNYGLGELHQTRDRYFELAYDILEYVLSPAL